MNNLNTLNLAIALISRPSITPKDSGCQSLVAERLKKIGFTIESLRFGEVDNLWARRGQNAPLFVFAGHTDVVSVGQVEKWKFPPFEPTISDGLLYGRGAADMKGGIAAMVTACEQFVADYPHHRGSIAFLLTSDEEGKAVDGTVKVINHLESRNEKIDWCLLGEPSSTQFLGDVVHSGRRGSLNGFLTIHGIQGHTAYPQLADNPIHRFAPVLSQLCQKDWGQSNAHFPATTFQISNIRAGDGTTNVIPNDLEVIFNFRYNTDFTDGDLKSQIVDFLDSFKLNYSIRWELSGIPFLTAEGKLLTATQESIKEHCGFETRISTGGGTSDGRFIAPTGAQVLELGHVNSTIHKINECIKVEDLDKLSQIYQSILRKLLVE
jgi:succinyl-diaminopimelate desuccinylase